MGVGTTEKGKKLGKKQREKQQAKQQAAKAARVELPDSTQPQHHGSHAETALTAAVPDAHAVESSQTAEPAVAVTEPSYEITQQSTTPAVQNGSTIEAAVAQRESATVSTTSGDGPPAVATVAQPDNVPEPSQPQGEPDVVPDLQRKPKPGKKAKAAVPIVKPTEPSDVLVVAKQQQLQPSAPVEPQSSSDVPAEPRTVLTDAVVGRQRRPVLTMPPETSEAPTAFQNESSDDWNCFNDSPQHASFIDAIGTGWTQVGSHQRQPTTSDMRDESSVAPALVNGRHQQHPVPTDVHYGESSAGWTHVTGSAHQLLPARVHAPPANMVAPDSEQPASAAVKEEPRIGLASMETAPPQRRRGVRAGKRHKKRYGARDAAARAALTEQALLEDNESDGTPRNRLHVAQLPRSPLAAGHSAWGIPGAAHVGNDFEFPPGFPIPSAATPTRAQLAADEAQAAEYASRAREASAAGRGVHEQSAQEDWPGLPTTGSTG